MLFPWQCNSYLQLQFAAVYRSVPPRFFFLQLKPHCISSRQSLNFTCLLVFSTYMSQMHFYLNRIELEFIPSAPWPRSYFTIDLYAIKRDHFLLDCTTQIPKNHRLPPLLSPFLSHQIHPRNQPSY